MKNNQKIIFAVLTLLILGAILFAMTREDNRTAGEKIGDAIDDTAEKLEDSREKINDDLEELNDELKNMDAE